MPPAPTLMFPVVTQYLLSMRYIGERMEIPCPPGMFHEFPQTRSVTAEAAELPRYVIFH